MIKRLIFTAFVLVACFGLAPRAAFAFDATAGVDCADKNNATSAVCTSSNNGKNNPLSGPNGLLIKITDIIAYVAGAAAVIVIIVGGIKFATAGGDSNNAASARTTVLNALIGLIVIVLARALIEYVIARV